MTARGRPAYIRPTTPLDPTLISWPDTDEVRRLIHQVRCCEITCFRTDGPPYGDPTWGFFIFVTAYFGNTTRDRIAQAARNFIEVMRRALLDITAPAYAEEALKRLKLDVIEDGEALDGASDDRVRKEFRAQIRALDLSDNYGEEDFFPLPARNRTCPAFDEATVAMLAGIAFPNNPQDDRKALEGKLVKVIDACWSQSSVNIYSSYRGWGSCHMKSLAALYMNITVESGGHRIIKDMHPMNGVV
ncbi:hypothetical protein PT974_02619 [Cladobotryum mycophilum]|uniref:Uncharacterized protein n=1 Tax=Cladobotryum mycophilum TaxID=491253 RepID=A0ABR0SZT8_9HYPO